MKTMFLKETLRTVRGSFGRFLAIVIIVAVGCGFFAGLRMTGVGMRKAADVYFDQTHLYDIQLTSSLGVTQSTVDIIKQVPGVGQTMCSKSVDAMAEVGQSNRAIRVTTLPSTSAEGNSKNPAALNQARLVSGRWPSAPNECVMLYKEADTNVLGENVKILYGSQSLDGVLNERDFEVVGLVTDPAFIETATIATTSLGSGRLLGVCLVSEDSFAKDSPYTEVSISVPAARDEIFGTQAYTDEVQNVKNALDQRLDDIADARRQEVQDKAESELNKNRKAYEQKRVDTYAKLNDAKAQIDTTEATLNQKQAKITQGSQTLAEEKVQVEEAYAAGLIPEEQYRAQMAQIAAQEEVLKEEQKEIDAGKAQLIDGCTQYENQKRVAEKELRGAKTKLDDAQKQIDNIEKPDVYVLTLDQNYGAASFKNDSERIDKIATVFPFFFFVVAALVALTTMMRMVEDDRQLMGTFKALGYSNARIASKYLLYAGIASALGAILGIALMSQLLPGVILQAYSIIYSMPARSYPLPIEVAPAIWASVLGVGITLAATMYACFSSFRETPATLMQPKAPKPGKRILLERIKPLWNRVSFSWKVTLRNIFRYKARFLMTVIGVAGCTMLLVTGFGVRDAINEIIDNQFGPSGITRFNTTIGLSDAADTTQAEKTVNEVTSYLSLQEGVSDIAQMSMENMIVHTAADGDKNHNVQVECPKDLQSFSELNNLRVRTTQAPIPFSENSVVLTEKIATTLKVKQGDELGLYEQDKIGNPTGSPTCVTITDICENYLGAYLYIGPAAFQDAFQKAPVPNTLICNIAGDSDARDRIAEHLQTMPNVDTVMYNDELINSYRNMLKSVDLVMVVLIVAAMVLAFVVLYNLANINIAERIREIASLKVLGFRRREVAAYVFREILLIVAFGALVGLFLGWIFEAYVVITAEVDSAMFGRVIHASSYLISLGLTLVFAAFVCLSMLPKLAHIDMVESLKSVD